MKRPKPWRLEAGIAAGLVMGGLWLWIEYDPFFGIFHDLHIVVIAAAIGMAVVAIRNRHKKVGPWDPNTIARNRKGRP
ncbi:hypothetical protein GRI58_02970 [Porphyrobacter algicida]|uniref:Uncharacterized protein n=1 Tax=Qipengyuania algicida TaxID=1836209 RepID=A0A845ADM6_9SPHN|nr:hypothetical protein [Qipengyuania algicida]MXP27784.1 hypothetical protein [Qipengyuania algicida]